MNRKELYYKTVNVLLDAYNNGTLIYGNCKFCVIGNLCKGDCNWSHLFTTDSIGKQHTEITNITIQEKNYALNLVKNTGYSIDELMKIEYVFETSIIKENHNCDVSINISNYDYWKNINTKQGQFIGLTAVLNVLKEIHTTPEEIVADNQNKLETIKNKFELV